MTEEIHVELEDVSEQQNSDNSGGVEDEWYFVMMLKFVENLHVITGFIQNKIEVGMKARVSMIWKG